ARTPHDQVVHGAVNGELADVAAREKDRTNHVAVRAHADPFAARQLEGCLIFEPGQSGVREGRQEHVAQQFVAQPPAAAVAEHDLLVPRQGQRTRKVERAHRAALSRSLGTSCRPYAWYAEQAPSAETI